MAERGVEEEVIAKMADTATEQERTIMVVRLVPKNAAVLKEIVED